MNEAKAIASVKAARDQHDNGGCRYGGRAIEAHLNPDDMAELGWTDGETLAGLALKSDHKVSRGRIRIYCDRELHGAEPHSVEGATTSTPVRVPERVPVHV